MTEPTKAGGPPAAAKGRRSRSPSFVYSGTTVVVLLVIAALTITASQTPPPAIAELSPSAVQQIKEPPPGQASSVGSADGGAGFGDAVTTTTTTTTPAQAPPKVFAPRQRSCVEDKQFGTGMRQTEDPQSPPCVALWTGKDNGGATTKGVTADEIRIAVPMGYGPSLTRGQKDVEAFFNKRFEFYGRRIKLVPVKVASDFASDTSTISSSADAVEAENVFASLNFTIQSGNETIYYDALAKKGIISVASSFVGTPTTTTKHMRDRAPYQWSYTPSIDSIFRNYVEFICGQLANKPPTFAGGRERLAQTRKFGILVDTKARASEPIDYRLLTDATLSKCGAQWFVMEQDLNPGEPLGGGPANGYMAKFKEEGVTTLMCMCGYAYVRNGLMGNATGQEYFPEYLVHNYGAQDTDYGGYGYNDRTDQRDHVIGLRSWSKALPREESFHWRAKREVDPTYPADMANYDTNYQNLMLLASGIQGAGPNLTPETFARALHEMQFPNPGCGKAPLYQACVGFEDGDFTMVNDFAPIWWGSDLPSNENDPAFDSRADRRRGFGAFCYPGRGTRFGIGTDHPWTNAQISFFQNPCN